VVRPGTLRLGLRLGHVTAMFGLAVPSVTGAVIDLAGGIDPDLTSAAIRARSGALACCGRGRGGVVTGLVAVEAAPHDCTPP
jgi:hypothetical protein